MSWEAARISHDAVLSLASNLAEKQCENTGKSLKSANDKVGSHRKDFTHLLYRVDILERKFSDAVENVKEKSSLESPLQKQTYKDSQSTGTSPSPLKTNRLPRSGGAPLEHDVASLKYDYLCMKKKVDKLASKRASRAHGDDLEHMGVDDFREQVEELQGDMVALQKKTIVKMHRQCISLMFQVSLCT